MSGGFDCPDCSRPLTPITGELKYHCRACDSEYHAAAVATESLERVADSDLPAAAIAKAFLADRDSERRVTQ